MKDETVYIVSGFMRTGTSMMMRALEAGGLEAVTRESRDTYRKKFKDDFYDPNEGGLYEIEPQDYLAEGFPRQFKGKLIKCLMGGIENIAVVSKLKIVYMRRDAEEIRQSYQAFFRKPMTLDPVKFEAKNKEVIASLQNRKDTDLIVLNYRDVVEHPLRELGKLKDDGWPIDLDKAVSIVDPSLLRFKRENLTPGIT